MSWEAIAALSFTFLVFAAVPGPGIMAVTSCALGQGHRPALIMTLGLTLGDMLYLTMAVFGLALVAQHLGDFFMIVRLGGAAYLIWLGIKLIRSRGHVDFDSAPDVSRKGDVKLAMTGFAVATSNPKVIAFYLGLLPTFVDLATITMNDYLILLAITAITIGGVVGAFALAAAKIRSWMRQPHRVKWMNRIAGAIMIATGAVLASKG